VPIFMLMLMLACFSAMLVEIEWSPDIECCIRAWLATGSIEQAFIDAHPEGVAWDCSTCGSNVSGLSSEAASELQQQCATCGGFPKGRPDCLGTAWAQRFPNIPSAMYFMTVTISTVGYGDLAPVTWGGRVFMCVVIMVGILFLALPLAMVADSFNKAWDSQVLLKLQRLMRQLAVENDLSNVKNCKRAFGHLASKGAGKGRIGYDEFANFVRSTLQLPLTEAEMIKLWDQLDMRRAGTISIDDFIALFFFHEGADAPGDSAPAGRAAAAAPPVAPPPAANGRAAAGSAAAAPLLEDSSDMWSDESSNGGSCSSSRAGSAPNSRPSSGQAPRRTVAMPPLHEQVEQAFSQKASTSNGATPWVLSTAPLSTQPLFVRNQEPAGEHAFVPDAGALAPSRLPPSPTNMCSRPQQLGSADARLAEVIQIDVVNAITALGAKLDELSRQVAQLQRASEAQKDWNSNTLAA